MRSHSMRVLSCAALAVLMLGVSGCSWFRGSTGYENSVETRSLEIPPDLDAPRVDPAMAVPSVGSTAATRAAGAPATASVVASGPFPVNDTLESTWRRLGIALERTDGVEIVERAQVLSAYSVRFDGSELLIRVSRVGDTSRVGAVDANGLDVTGGAAGKLLALLRTRLS